MTTEQSSPDHNSTYDELEKLLNDEEFCRIYTPRKGPPCIYIVQNIKIDVYDSMFVFC
jgi:hypothetical protein